MGAFANIMQAGFLADCFKIYNFQNDLYSTESQKWAEIFSVTRQMCFASALPVTIHLLAAFLVF
eukprot:Pgem_evm1s13827